LGGGLTDLSRYAVAGAIVISVLLSSIAFIVTFTDDGPRTEGTDLERLSAVLSGSISDLVSTADDLTDEQLGDMVEDLLPDLAAGAGSVVEGYTVHVFESDVTVERSDLPASMPSSPSLLSTSSGRTVINAMGYGRTGPLPAVPVLTVSADIGIRLEPIAGGEKVFSRLRVTSETIDSAIALERLLDMAGEQMDGYGSPLARDVEYMLNTLVRVRSINRFGWENYQDEYNVLNEGDVELAFNLALAIRLSALTGHVPQELVASIDQMFTRQTSSLIMNPTGYRIWGLKEKANFRTYEKSSGLPSQRRSASGLLDAAVEMGHADTADLFARFLYLEKLYSGGSGYTPPRFIFFDQKGALEEAQLINPRQRQDLSDPFSLRSIATFPDEDGIALASRDLQNPDAENLSFRPVIDTANGMQVLSMDIRATGIDDVDAWYTEVALNRSAESLININVTPGRGGDTRCGGVVPPLKPPSHDFRLQWDITIKASIDLKAYSFAWRGNSINDPQAARTINISFPVRVLAWNDQRSSNDDIPWTIRYVTDTVNNEFASGYIIKPEANATEFFESIAFQPLREAFDTIISLGRYVQGLGQEELPDTDDRASLHLMAVQAVSDLTAWERGLNGSSVQNLVKLLWDYLDNGSLIPYVEPIKVDGLTVVLLYSAANDRLDIVAELPSGSATLSVTGLRVPPMTFRARVVPGPQMTIDLDIGKGTFSLNWNSVREGTQRPSAPDGELLDLVLGTSWEGHSPSLSIDTVLSQAYPVENYPPAPSHIPEVSLSFVLRGSDRSPEESIADLQALLSDRPLRTEGDIISALIAAANGHAGTDTWSGVRVIATEGGRTIARTMYIRTADPMPPGLAMEPSMVSLLRNVLYGSSQEVSGPDLDGIDIITEVDLGDDAPGPAQGLKFCHHRVSSALTRADGFIPHLSVFSSTVPVEGYDDWGSGPNPTPEPLW